MTQTLNPFFKYSIYHSIYWLISKELYPHGDCKGWKCGDLWWASDQIPSRTNEFIYNQRSCKAWFLPTFNHNHIFTDKVRDFVGMLWVVGTGCPDSLELLRTEKISSWWSRIFPNIFTESEYWTAGEFIRNLNFDIKTMFTYTYILFTIFDIWRRCLWPPFPTWRQLV